MDPVLRATADVGQASFVATLGDDTSSGKSWEAFSLRSFTTNFKDMTRIAVGGNHDNGEFVIDHLDETGSITPNGELQEIEGITIAMRNDPRKSDFTPEKREGELSYSEATEKLTDLACSADEKVDLVLTHSASMGREALARGCAELVIGGHLHSYSAPELVIADNGETGYTVTNGTSGGAVFSFALGTGLKREANAILATFDSEGSPVGIQNIRYMPNGTVLVDEFVELTFQPVIPSLRAENDSRNKTLETQKGNTPLKKQ